VTEENYWYSHLEARASREAAIIVDAFCERGIDIGGETDRAEEDRDLHPGGIAFMYDRDHILTREQYLGGVGGMRGPRSPAIGYPQVCDVLFSPGLPVRNS
jgi:hypothetical protein